MLRHTLQVQLTAVTSEGKRPPGVAEQVERIHLQLFRTDTHTTKGLTHSASENTNTHTYKGCEKLFFSVLCFAPCYQNKKPPVVPVAPAPSLFSCERCILGMQTGIVTIIVAKIMQLKLY